MATHDTQQVSVAPLLRGGWVDISPERLPIAIAGYGSLETAERCDDRLEANLLWFGDDQDFFILASFDALFAGHAMRQCIAREAGCAEWRVLVAASHTHYAPALEVTKPGLGKHDDAHFEMVKEGLARLVREVREQKPRRFAQGLGEASTQAGVYRRLWWSLPHLGGRSRPIVGAGIKNAPNFSVSIDNMLRLLQLRQDSLTASSAAPLAAIWTLACHPTRYPSYRAVTAEYPGLVRRRLRKAIGRELPVVFLQGFSGDIAPRPKQDGGQGWVSRLAFGPRMQNFSAGEWSAWSNAIARSSVEALENCNVEAPVGPLQLSSTQLNLNRLLPREAGKTVELACIRSGSWAAVLVSAEVLSPFARLLPNSAWGIGCTNDSFGYWPNNRQVREGGYEVEGFLKPFGLNGPLAPDMEGPFRDGLSRLGSDVS